MRLKNPTSSLLPINQELWYNQEIEVWCENPLVSVSPLSCSASLMLTQCSMMCWRSWKWRWQLPWKRIWQQQLGHSRVSLKRFEAEMASLMAELTMKLNMGHRSDSSSFSLSPVIFNADIIINLSRRVSFQIKIWSSISKAQSSFSRFFIFYFLFYKQITGVGRWRWRWR